MDNFQMRSIERVTNFAKFLSLFLFLLWLALDLYCTLFRRKITKFLRHHWMNITSIFEYRNSINWTKMSKIKH